MAAKADAQERSAELVQQKRMQQLRQPRAGWAPSLGCGHGVHAREADAALAAVLAGHPLSAAARRRGLGLAVRPREPD